MQYVIKKIDGKPYEFDIVNCDTVKIYKKCELLGRYDLTKNVFYASVDKDWGFKAWDLLTNRQQRLVLLQANKYLLKVYKNAYYSDVKAGRFFAPTKDNLDAQNYYCDKINSIKANIELLQKEDTKIYS